MGKVIWFAAPKPEREVIYIEILPEWRNEPRAYVKYLYEKGLIESESEILSYLESENRKYIKGLSRKES